MTINSAFSTQITAQTGVSGQSGTPAGKAAGGLAFFDLILSHAEKAIDQQLQTLQTARTIATAAPSDALQISAQLSPEALSLVNEQTNLNITEALANSAYATDKLVKSGDADISAALALTPQTGDGETLSLQIPGKGDEAKLSTDALQNAIISGTTDLKPALNNLQRILQKLQTLAQQDSPSLIGTNITPEQITDLQKKVEDLLNGVTEDGKTEAEEFAGIFAGLIQILPVQAKQEETALAATAEDSLEAVPAPEDGAGKEAVPGLPAGTKPTDDLAARLNGLIAGGTKDGAVSGKETTGLPPQPAAPVAAHAHAQAAAAQAQDQTPAQTTAAQNAAQHSSAASAKSSETDSEGLPEAEDGDSAFKADAAASKTAKVSPRDAAMAAAQHAKAQAGGSASDLSALKSALPFLFGDGSPYATGFYTTTAASAGTEGYGLGLGAMSAMTQGIAASNVMTQAPQAGMLHPGTQMIAASLQKAGSAGQNSRITLQLDPPELGRVEIKMSFEKNSKVKAVLTVEKPETHAMLQKDSGVLERILQGAGLHTDDGSLSFELAKDGYTFGRDGQQQDGGQGDRSRRAEDDNGDEIIQATMNWAVDPQTGHMHYNIMA